MSATVMGPAALVTKVTSEQDGHDEEWVIQLNRIGPLFNATSPPMELPDDVREALTKWLGAGHDRGIALCWERIRKAAPNNECLVEVEALQTRYFNLGVTE